MGLRDAFDLVIPVEPQNRQCKGCMYWQECDEHLPTPIIGECHRLPPLADDGSQEGFWPWVGGENWCGEWKKRL